MTTTAQPVFDHRDAGTAPAAWAGLLAHLPTLKLPPASVPMVVLAAHPDDETLGAGGLIAAAQLRGNPLTVIIASDGEASHPHSPTHTPEMLRTLRRPEAAAAVGRLAPDARLRFLALPDGRLESHVDAITDALTAAVTPGAPAWVVAPWAGDRHPDHAACARAARRVPAAAPAVTVWEYPIWLWHWGNPGGRDLPVSAAHRLPAPPGTAAVRMEALACYRSQAEPLSGLPGDEPIISPTFTAHFDRSFDVLIDPHGSAARAAHFDELYGASDDPWGLAERWYEQRKRALLLACLPRRRFVRAFEPGCAGGLLTAALAERCDQVVAGDAAARAVELARSRLAGRQGVSIAMLAIPDQWPAGQFDLIVLSEIGYYVKDLDALARRVSDSLTADGVVLLCHWRHPAIEHPRSAEEVHAAIGSLPRLHVIAQHREADFLLAVLSVDGDSVARAEGITR